MTDEKVTIVPEVKRRGDGTHPIAPKSVARGIAVARQLGEKPDTVEPMSSKRAKKPKPTGPRNRPPKRYI